MGAESNMRQRVIRLMKEMKLDPISVENPAYPGTPDINYLHGWLELKQVEDWPVRGGPLRLPHYTQEQRLWALRRMKAGGRCYLLLRVNRDWMLFDGATAAQHLGHRTRDELLSFCLAFQPLLCEKVLFPCREP